MYHCRPIHREKYSLNFDRYISHDLHRPPASITRDVKPGTLTHTRTDTVSDLHRARGPRYCTLEPSAYSYRTLYILRYTFTYRSTVERGVYEQWYRAPRS